MSSKIGLLFCCAVVLLVSYFTYLDGYSKPKESFYDEHYYIVHAERYIHRIVFFDINPPLGKMFIALGERILSPNKQIDMKDYLERTSLGFNSIDGFSYSGVRLFPSLFGFLNGLLLFLIFYGLSKNSFLSLMFSSLYLFENSSIVHFRAAMLDSTLVFFSFLTILYFIYLYEKKEKKKLMDYFILGLLTGLAVLTKAVGLILLLLPCLLVYKEFKTKFRYMAMKLLKVASIYFLGLCTVCLLVFYIHMSLGANILVNDIGEVDGLFTGGASKEYVKMIKDKDIYDPLKLFIPIRDNFLFVSRSQPFIPKLSTLPGDIGSPPYTWPLGIKNINYSAVSTNGEKVGYLNFQGNPVNWIIGLLSVLFSLGVVVAKVVFKIKISNMRTYRYIFIFISLYVGYMIPVMFLSMHRVLYIHTYLLPLFFSFILSFLAFNYVFEKYILNRDRVLFISLSLLMSQVLFVYLCAAPVTYGRQITYLECERTRLIDFWEDYCNYE